ncbi:hypothetical protein GCM10010193_57650 [Kitasatospora atroaurantiaca]|uniref:Uncharacterized protein n=1 Tax=Kitasatospora atroaurantiaca TaxID=285545 RepID=A0A561EN28_9ACTN|nr:hypothetical protein [Kitasatospora atroaurantiaca]TWE17010.1 hypothetical protein FB465_2007 [Kitasatospora atroaurantiaca]
MDGLIFGVCSLATAIGAAICFRYAYRLRDQPTYRVARWSRALAVVVCFIGSLTAVPVVADVFNRATGVGNGAKLVAHLCAVLFCACLQIMIVDWMYEKPYVSSGVWARVVLVASVVTALTFQFRTANDPGLPFTTDSAHNLPIVAYLLTYLGFLAIAGLEISVLSAGMAVHSWRDRQMAAVGLTLVALGGASCVAYSISKGGYLIAVQVSHPWALGTEQAVSSPLAGVGVLFVVIGLCVTIAGSRRAVVRR